MKEKTESYPSWVCIECAETAVGKWQNRVATFHDGTCCVCGKKKYVTEPRDFGYPRFDTEREDKQK